MNEFHIIFTSLILILLIVLSAFFSCAETALMAVNRYRLRHKARIKKRYAQRLLKLLKRPDRVLGAILIGSTFANILASSLATLIAFHFWGNDGALIAAMVLTLVVLILAEITPKTFAAIYADKVSQWLVYPIQVVLWILYPLVYMANGITNGLLKLLRVNISAANIEPFSRDELRSVVYDTTGKISRQYQNMLLSILDLSKLKVDDVMVPRYDILGIDIEEPWELILEKINRTYFDWLPVYRESINHLIGVLYVRDILRSLLIQHNLNKELLSQFLQEAYFVPEGTPLSTQLGYFQQTHHKIAFVVDEYGEIQGLLTLSDIVGEIVGDFTSNLTGEKRIQIQNDGSYLVDGAVTIREFNRISAWDLPLNGQRTVNGLIIEHLEALPHEKSTVLISGYPIEIIHTKENRVKLAKVFPRLLRK